MASRRMFSLGIIDSDVFMDMPLSTQALYFHLSMRADDDGFINNPKKIKRMVGATDDDLKVLIAKGFIIPFDSGVVVIKHWRIHNYIQNDRYKETVYFNEKAQLYLEENKAYTLNKGNCVKSVSKLDTQTRLDKTSIEKTSIDKISIEQTNNGSWEGLPGGTIYEMLSDDERGILDSTFDNVLGLIDLIDDSIKGRGEQRPIKNPLKYIQVVAEAKGWPLKSKENKK